MLKIPIYSIAIIIEGFFSDSMGKLPFIMGAQIQEKRAEKNIINMVSRIVSLFLLNWPVNIMPMANPTPQRRLITSPLFISKIVTGPPVKESNAIPVIDNRAATKTYQPGRLRVSGHAKRGTRTTYIVVKKAFLPAVVY